MGMRHRGAGSSAGFVAAIGMALVGAVVALTTGLGQGIGNASVAPEPSGVTAVVLSAAAVPGNAG